MFGPISSAQSINMTEQQFFSALQQQTNSIQIPRNSTNTNLSLLQINTNHQPPIVTTNQNINELRIESNTQSISKDAQRKRKKRAAETTEQRNARLHKKRNRMRKRRQNFRANATPAELAAHKQKQAQAKKKQRAAAQTKLFLLDEDLDDFEEENVQRSNVGSRTQETQCPHCSAELWEKRNLWNSKKSNFWNLLWNWKFQVTSYS